MSRNKLAKYQALQNYHNIYEVTPGVGDLLFTNQNISSPTRSDNIYNIYNQIIGEQKDKKIILELCCAAGDYMIGLAQLDLKLACDGRSDNANNIYIGIEIKGDRVLKGVQKAQQLGLDNIYMIRCDIRQLEEILPPHCVDEIWITFPDPQPNDEHSRVTNSKFLSIYDNLLKSNGLLHIKTDDPDFYIYTRNILTDSHFEICIDINDVVGFVLSENYPKILPEDSLKKETINGLINKLSIVTWYEKRWRLEGKKIYYIQSIIKQS